MIYRGREEVDDNIDLSNNKEITLLYTKIVSMLISWAFCRSVYILSWPCLTPYVECLHGNCSVNAQPELAVHIGM